MGMEEQALLELRQITELQEATVKVIHSDNSTLSNTYLIPEVKSISRPKNVFWTAIKFRQCDTHQCLLNTSII